MNSGDSVMNSAQAITEVLRAVGALFEPGDVIEIRALDVGRTPDRAGNTFAGYFNFENSEAIASAIRKVDGSAEGVYVVLNRFNPDLLARSNNRHHRVALVIHRCRRDPASRNFRHRRRTRGRTPAHAGNPRISDGTWVARAAQWGFWQRRSLTLSPSVLRPGTCGRSCEALS